MFECPVPESVSDRIQMAHGGGGRLMNDLIRSVFLEAFGSPSGSVQNDSAVLSSPAGRLAVTTDSFVVQPLEFPGGNIGSLAVHGTVNDLAMSGAEPLYLTAGFILEEGLPLDVLNRVVHSMAEAPSGGRAHRHRGYEGSGTGKRRWYLYQYRRGGSSAA